MSHWQVQVAGKCVTEEAKGDYSSDVEALKKKRFASDLLEETQSDELCGSCVC